MASLSVERVERVRDETVAKFDTEVAKRVDTEVAGQVADQGSEMLLRRLRLRIPPCLEI